MDRALNGILAFAVAAAVILAILWPRTVFRIVLSDGEARLEKGRLPARLMNDISSIVEKDRSLRGSIAGINQIGFFRIRYSRDFPESLRQPFRNLWAIHMRGRR